jgi:hypothetical protein
MTGSGNGKVELKLPKTVYSVGERIKGTLLLTVNRPVDARGLYVVLSAEQSFREQIIYRNGAGTRTVSRRIFCLQQRLDRDRHYQKTTGITEYPFAVTLPPIGIGGQGSALPPDSRSIRSGDQRVDLLQAPVGPARWILEGCLDIPHALDMITQTAIQVGHACTRSIEEDPAGYETCPAGVTYFQQYPPAPDPQYCAAERSPAFELQQDDPAY